MPIFGGFGGGQPSGQPGGLNVGSIVNPQAEQQRRQRENDELSRRMQAEALAKQAQDRQARMAGLDERRAQAETARATAPAPQAPPPVQRQAPQQPAVDLKSVYQQFLQSMPRPAAAPVVAQSAPVQDATSRLLERAEADRVRQDAERAAMREQLMGRISQASSPVSADDPGIKSLIAAQRLARQRAAERQRSQMAVRLEGEGLGDSGAFDTAMSGIEQQRGEGEAGDIAEVMSGEHQAKRAELLQLYQLAVSQGDAESARTAQAQLAALDAQLEQLRMAQQQSQFASAQNQNQAQFNANLAARLLQ